MKRRPIVRIVTHSALALAVLLILANKAFAQESQTQNGIASLSFFIILAMAIYAYMALAVQTIARKLEIPHDWFAWIPIANLFLLLAMARKPLWWFFLLLVPVVNIVISIMVWMEIAKNRGKPTWLGFLLLLPLISLVVPGYLAWSE